MAKSTCSVDGCEVPARSRGWCSKHYQRWRAHGDPVKTLHGWNARESDCEFCRGGFKSIKRGDGNWTRFCSKSCARKAQFANGSHPFQRAGSRSIPRGGTPVLACEECGDTYRRQATRAGRFCSKECYLLNAERNRAPAACRLFTGRCEQCGGSWSGRHRRTYCSNRCRRAASWARQVLERQATCGTCGTLLTSATKYCSPECKLEGNRRSRRAYKQRRRAMKGSPSRATERVVAMEVFERDGWLCGLCRKPIDRDVEYPSPLSASLDHIVPLSWGGAHVALNVQATHLGCNMRKGARVEHVQPPLLVG